eukprot:gene1554-1894_t
MAAAVESMGCSNSGHDSSRGHLEKPLELRHPFIFYLGHLPAFTDARVARVLQQQLTGPAAYATMFARGIDPDLNDPSQWTGEDLAALAAMPAELQHVLWMSFEHEAMHLETFMYMLLQYKDVLPPPQHLNMKQQQDLTPKGASAGFAGCYLPGACGGHQHVESVVLAPAQIVPVLGGVQHRPVTVLEYCHFLAEQLASRLRHNAMASVPQQPLIPSESESAQDEVSSSGNAAAAASDTLRFADISDVAQQLQRLLQADSGVHSLMPLSLQVDPDSITAECEFLSSFDGATSVSVCNKTAAPAQITPAQAPDVSGVVFSVLQQLLRVKSVFGLVPLAEAGFWPVYCSALQAGQYAEWFSRSAHGLGRDWRLMTENEWLLARQHNMGWGQADGDAVSESAVDWSAMAAASTSASDIGVNFNTWHPTPVALLPSVMKVSCSSSNVLGSAGGDQLLVSQLNTNGWEWTSTPFGPHPGFQADLMYPEYSTDFFDGRHLVLRGASWATLDCLASRGSFRNW